VGRAVTWQASIRPLTALQRATPCFAPSTQQDNTRIDCLYSVVAEEQVNIHAKHSGRVEPRGERNMGDQVCHENKVPGQGGFEKFLHEKARRIRMNKIRHDHAKVCIHKICLLDVELPTRRQLESGYIKSCVVLEPSTTSGNLTARRKGEP
jgi:hypothetical protein